MRGVASGDNGNHSGPMPSVGQYLDEQPITTIQGALDIHIYDIERVEMLAGPAGHALRRQFPGRHDPHHHEQARPHAIQRQLRPAGQFRLGRRCRLFAEGYVNLPINDSTAVRLVGWYDHSPGYIDNVKGTMTFPTSGITMTNYDRVAGRLQRRRHLRRPRAAKIDLNDTWSVMPGVMGQVANYDGLIAYDPGSATLS